MAAENASVQPWLLQETLFTSGDGRYHTYRIPALAVSARGTVLAFAEGRKHGRGDAGDIDLILRRSFDNGRTWAPIQVVVTEAGMTCGNPLPRGRTADRNRLAAVLQESCRWRRNADLRRQGASHCLDHPQC